MGTAFMALMAVVIWAIPRPLITLFLDDTIANAEVIALGVSFLGIAAIFQIVDGAHVVGAGILRGLHDTRVPMIINIVGFWLLGIPTSVYLGFRTSAGPRGLWWGLVFGLAIVSLVLAARARAQLGRRVERLVIDHA